ncbi:TRAP transporter small permease subunit [Desulfobacula sp.]|uniref:TRAP transporter small permease n=1 Tax=Desulfobacula sp. TaxID=2593537 RepID=UPI0026285DE3|nr:TRAP transporter small permease subunit [Desulfobacula sp.]
MTFFIKLDQWISTFENFIVSTSMIVTASSLLLSVICRQLNIIMAGGEEVALFAIVWMTFLGTALCARKGNHIVMSAVLDSISTNKKKKVVTAICLFSALFCFLLFIFGTQLTWDVFQRGQVTPALRAPLWCMYISLPIGFFLTGVYYLMGFFHNLTRKEMYMGLEIT